MSLRRGLTALPYLVPVFRAALSVVVVTSPIFCAAAFLRSGVCFDEQQMQPRVKFILDTAGYPAIYLSFLHLVYETRPSFFNISLAAID